MANAEAMRFFVHPDSIGGRCMNLSNIITLLGGVGMFLYGMKLLGVSLERFAGRVLKRRLND